MKALVLSGGGARGAYEAGVASTLAKSQSYDVICGTSIGAINAAFVSTGRADRLESFWCEVLPARLPKLLPHIPRMRHMLADFNEVGQGSRWNAALHLFHALSDMRFLQIFREPHGLPSAAVTTLARELDLFLDLSKIQCWLMVAATNVTLGLPTTFYAHCDPSTFATPSHRAERSASIEWRLMESERFALAILASAALPGLLAPIALEFEEKLCGYADGSLVHNSPIGLAIDASATDITAVFVDPVSKVPCSCPEPGVGRMACAVFMLWQQRLLDYEMRLIDATNALIRSGALPNRHEIRVQSVRPEQPLAIHLLGFDDAAAVRRIFLQGALDAERGLHRL
jgi:predicted acylesterase/phospholipase RssA